jgi:hypothetical protein
MVGAAARAVRGQPDAARRVAAFVRSSALPDGGFRGRAARSDLYYTVFAMQALCALGREDRPGGAAAVRGGPGPRIAGGAAAATETYLTSFGDGAALDFVHAACLARCWSLVAGGGPPADVRGAILSHIETYRAADGGYNPAPGSAAGTAYGAFLALGAWQDLGAAVPDAAALGRSLEGLRSDDGGYANVPGAARGSTAATAAAMVTLAELGGGTDRRAADFLLARAVPEGGFLAAPAAPIPDLLSTATALHALARAGVSLDAVRGPCLEFAESLWSEDGGFRGHRADDETDCEYTFYGLLALGHLGP